MTDRRKVQMWYCRWCRQYTAGCPHKPKVSPISDKETPYGWVALAVFIGMGVVFYLGSCA